MTWHLVHIHTLGSGIRPLGRYEDFAVLMGQAARDAGHDLIWRGRPREVPPLVMVEPPYLAFSPMAAQDGRGGWYLASEAAA